MVLTKTYYISSKLLQKAMKLIMIWSRCFLSIDDLKTWFKYQCVLQFSFLKYLEIKSYILLHRCRSMTHDKSTTVQSHYSILMPFYVFLQINFKPLCFFHYDEGIFARCTIPIWGLVYLCENLIITFTRGIH